jgi:uncharacterized Fe-S cluster-containing radical SAM superfamily protein
MRVFTAIGNRRGYSRFTSSCQRSSIVTADPAGSS